MIIRCSMGIQIALSAAMAQLPPIPEADADQGEPAPRLYVERRLIELGPVLEGDKHTVTWRLENRGHAPLIIDRTRASCGCTVVKLTKAEKTIPPGKTLALRAEFNSAGRRGKQSKSITVYSNDPAEPTIKLEFTATVETLFRVEPPGVVNLQAVRRGEQASRTIEFHSVSGQGDVEILELRGTEHGPLNFSRESFTSRGLTGERIRMAVAEHVPLGTLSTKLTARLRVGSVERERTIQIRVEVVGDLTWRPKIVNNTRLSSQPGKRFAPITIRSTDASPFDITRADAGIWFDASVRPIQKGPRHTRYSVSLVLRDDAPIGPFATTLEIHTTSLDQPVIRVPVFGIVAPRIAVEPALIALRQDGTTSGTRRRVKLQVPPQVKLEVRGLTTDDDAVAVTVDQGMIARYQHLRFLDVRLVGKLPEGRHHALLIVTTNVPGAERLEIPIRIDVPGRGG